MEWAWLAPALSFAASGLIVVLGRYLPGKGSFLACATAGIVTACADVCARFGARTGSGARSSTRMTIAPPFTELAREFAS